MVAILSRPQYVKQWLAAFSTAMYYTVPALNTVHWIPENYLRSNQNTSIFIKEIDLKTLYTSHFVSVLMW